MAWRHPSIALRFIGDSPSGEAGGRDSAGLDADS